MNAEQIETIAQAIADAAYNAAHEALAAGLIAHTAPGVVIAQAAPETAADPVVMLPQATAQPATETAQADTVNGWTAPDAYAAYRIVNGLTQAQWKEVKADKAATAAIRAAQVAPFDRHTQKGDKAAAHAAFGLAYTPEPEQAAQPAQATQAAPVAAPASITLPGIGQAPTQAQAAKVQPAGTVALNALKRFTKAHGLQIPARAADVDAQTFAAVKAHVEAERAQGHTVNAETVCAWLSAQTGM